MASLKKDHCVYPWEGNKSFRGVWGKKKARIAKRARANFKRALVRMESDADSTSRSIKQPRGLRKTGVITVEQRLHIKKQGLRARFSTFKYRSSGFKKK